MSNYKNFGEAFRAIFEAHFQDVASDARSAAPGTVCTRYTHEKLKAAFDLVPLKWKKGIYSEFMHMAGRLREQILTCKHEKFKVPYDGAEECELCGASRRKVRKDDSFGSYDETMIWTEWDV